MFAPTKDIAFPLVGGLDLVSSHLKIHPGRLISCENLEIIAGNTGYSVPGGYERCTDDTLPSDIGVYFFVVISITTDISIDDEFTSGSKTVKALNELISPQDDDVLVVASHDASFADSSVWTKSGNQFTLDSTLPDTSDYTKEQLQAYYAQAVEQTRDAIPEVTGTGVVNGGFRLRGFNYVFRDAKLYKGGDYSWAEVVMPHVMYFEGGTVDPTAGDTITDGVETGVIASVTRQSGVYDYGQDLVDQSAGYYTLTGTSGTFTIGNEITVDGATVTAITNGDFTNATGWTTGVGCTITTGTPDVAWSGVQSADSLCSRDYIASKYDTIDVTVVVNSLSAGSFLVRFGTDDSESVETTGAGTYVLNVVLTADCTTFAIVADVDLVGAIASVTASIGAIAKVKTENAEHVLPNPAKYETKNYNFTNLVNNESTFGVSGYGPAFEFDGTNYIPIFNPDAVNDTPYHLNIHQERLGLVYGGGQKAYSPSGIPRAISNSLLGAGVWSTGSEITGLRTIHANAEIVFTKENAWMLTGDGIYSDDTATRNWSFFEFGEDIGAVEWSLNGHGVPVYMSFSGIYQLLSTETSGGYASREIAELIQPFLDANKSNVVGALWSRNKSQYRIFFSTGKAVYIAFYGGKVSGATIISFPDGVTNVWSEVEDETEYLFFTSETGFLYRMDSGSTFDTYYREGLFRLPFYNYGNSRVEKLFTQMILEIDPPVLLTESTEIIYTTNHNYGSADTPRPLSENVTELDSAGGEYGNNAGYGGFVWSGALVSEIQSYLDGYGSNLSILVTYKTKYDSSFSFLTATIDFIEEGRKGQK